MAPTKGPFKKFVTPRRNPKRGERLGDLIFMKWTLKYQILPFKHRNWRLNTELDNVTFMKFHKLLLAFKHQKVAFMSWKVRLRVRGG